MNRIIKFRGKSLNTGNWVYGDLTQRGKRMFIEYEVNPATVGQFTGLYDANGREIYEGDIIQSSINVFRHVIGYNDDLGGFSATLANVLKTECHLERRWINEWGKVVIGNIHDNPEQVKSDW